MRIRFERSGGLIGKRMVATVDTESLSEEEARLLRSLVDAARFFDLPPTISAPVRIPDQFQYRLTVEVEGRRHTVEMSEATAPAELRPLLRRLTEVARSVPDAWRLED